MTVRPKDSPGVLALFVMALAVPCAAAQGLARVGGGQPAVSAPAAAEPQKDPLGRGSPRGTVLGFLAAARKGEQDLARYYLNTPLADAAARRLAHQLFIVLDARLPARLTQVSDAVEGSQKNPLTPDQDVIGTVAGLGGTVDIVVERVMHAKAGPIWLFSAATLEKIPSIYAEVTTERAAPIVPRFLMDRRIAGIRLFDWLAVLLAFPVFYLATVLLNRALMRNVLPLPGRLLLVAIACRWLFAVLPLSLPVRQFMSTAGVLVTVSVAAWLLLILNAETERYLCRRVPRANASAAVSLLRVGRRLVDVLILLIALLATLRHFGVDPTPVLAGLGVGGIAVALAAQKTLENVIAGASLIFDQAVRVGDFLKVAEIEGTVEHIGLRSTRIRTLDRAIVSVPNSQIANMSLSTLSARDKFWFHPIVGLRYETTTDQLQAVLGGIRNLLLAHPSVDRESVRVRFIRLGAFSLDVEVFAYVFARDWARFLEIQEELLFKVTDAVQRAGTSIAFPSQTMYVSGEAGAWPDPRGRAIR